MSNSQEPAIQSYWFGRAYRELQSTIKDCWQQNVESAQRYREYLNRPSRNNGEKTIVRLFVFGVILSIYVFGTALFLALSAVHVLIVVVLAGMIMLAFGALRGIEEIYRRYKGWKTFCPHDSLPVGMPVYECPECHAMHRRLLPSSYGLLWRRCSCGKAKLPCSLFSGRGSLPGRCPHCLHPLGVTQARTVIIPLVGGASAGKSTYVAACAHKLIATGRNEGYAGCLETEARIVDSQVQHQFGRLWSAIQTGQMPDKTQFGLPRAFDLYFPEFETTLFLYDPSGEVFRESDNLPEQAYHEHSSGYLLLVDPFTIPAVKQNYSADELDLIRPSLESPMDVLNHFLIGLQEHFNVQATQKIRKPIAVVLTKMRFAPPGRQPELFLKLLQKHRGLEATLPLEEVNSPRGYTDACRSLLLEWDQADLVSTLEMRFTDVRFFACSAIDFDVHNQLQAPRGALAPLVWLLRNRNEPLGVGWDDLQLIHGENALRAKPTQRRTLRN